MAQPTEPTWKWWITGFGIPLAGLLVAVGTLYVMYQDYAKDVQEIRASVEKDLRPRIEELERTVEAKNVEIADLQKKLAGTNEKPFSPIDPVMKFDFSKYSYLMKPEPTAAETTLGRWLDFFKANWKPLVPLGVLALMWMFSMMDKK
jgi:hypothetical protein